ncbi:DMT family transporter [Catellatospora vulcania]|uniref:DMT family transporter n=1 Tax=Catellatospora vulcania TaxID=1460450 RepID=UPI0012D4C10C|nr:DMT family transporter [Catellatospora vulcania]
MKQAQRRAPTGAQAASAKLRERQAVSYVFMGRFLTGRGIAPLMLSAGQLGAATVLLALALPVFGRQEITWRADAVVSVAVLGALGTGVAYVLNYPLITDVGSTAASVVTYLLPVVAIVLGAALLGEALTVAMVGGTVLVLVGVLLTQRGKREPVG